MQMAEFLTVLLIAVGLAMDAFSVSIAGGVVYKRFHLPNALKMAAVFGLFQAFMPIIGWLCGMTIKEWISPFEHWIAFTILAVIGAKMIYEAFKIEEVEKEPIAQSLPVLLTLAIATSIDALAVGFTITLTTSHIFTAVAIIGAVTFLLCLAGVYIGTRFGHTFENKAEIAGGVVLILIGIKMLIT